MAEKVLKTRIKLKYDEYANWTKNDPVLKKGEMAVTVIPTGASVEQTTPPAIMFKVGDGTKNFSALPWASALAANVYAWAKKAAPEAADFSAVIAAARDGLISSDSVVKTLNNLKGDVTLETTADETRLSVGKDGQKITLSLTFTDEEKAALASGITATKVAAYDAYATGKQDKIDASHKISHEYITGLGTAATKNADAFDAAGAAAAVLGESTDAATENTVYGAKAAATAAQSTADAAKTTANAALPKSEFTTFKTGNDTVLAGKVDKTTTVNGHELSENITVTKSDVGLGNVENKALDTTVTKDSGNYITSGAVKTAIDSAISGVIQFDIVKYDSFDKLPATGKKGVIYVVEHAHSDENDSCDEYIWNTALTTPAYEKIGNTDVNLSEYINTLSGTANSGVVTNILKSGNTLTVTSASLETAAPAASGTTLSFIDSVSQASNGKITATKKTVSDVTTTAHGLMSAADKVKLNGIAEGATNVTDTTVSGWGYIKSYTDTNQKIKAKSGATDVTFGDNDVVEFVAGSNVTITPDKTNKKITIAATQKSDAAINGLIDTKLNAYTTAHPGVNKTGTVTSVSATAGSGLKITGTATTTPNIDWDDTVTLVFDCGDSTNPI
jgi:hypothetical protein|nr:MAG TPA: hyaluronidase [Caudoviricetes sp.]